MISNNLIYVGSASTLQTGGVHKMMKYTQKPSYSARQNQLYERLLFGQKAYTEEEWYALNSTKKKRIIKQHKKAQNILNLWKQELMIAKSDTLYDQIMEQAQKLVNEVDVTKVRYKKKNRVSCRKIIKKPAFSLAGILNALSTDIEPDPNFRCTLSFKDLGITKEKIIAKFMEQKLLPSDFNTL